MAGPDDRGPDDRETDDRHPGAVEERLTGGNMSAVSRRGSDVLRTAGPWTPTIHRLLAHLRRRGVPGVPEPRGIEPDGRERIEFLDGLVPRYPMPTWIWADDVLVAAAQRLRVVHDAGTDFDRTDAVWQLPARDPAEVICHNDFAPYNLVFDDAHRLSAVIDWDTASPGSRRWDLAYLGYRLVPLTDPANDDAPALEDDERRRRLDLLIASYGRPEITRTELLRTAVERIAALADFTAARADPAANSLAQHVLVYHRDLAWLAGWV